MHQHIRFDWKKQYWISVKGKGPLQKLKWSHFWSHIIKVDTNIVWRIAEWCAMCVMFIPNAFLFTIRIEISSEIINSDMNYITYIIHVVKVKNNAVLLSYYKYILRLLLHFKQMFAHSSLVLLLIFTWRNFIIIWLRYLMYSSFLFWFKAGCPLDLTEGNFDNKKCISPNKADLFEGSVFLYGESYFKKNQSNINITLYNC